MSLMRMIFFGGGYPQPSTLALKGGELMEIPRISPALLPRLEGAELVNLTKFFKSLEFDDMLSVSEGLDALTSYMILAAETFGEVEFSFFNIGKLPFRTRISLLKLIDEVGYDLIDESLSN